MGRGSQELQIRQEQVVETTPVLAVIPMLAEPGVARREAPTEQAEEAAVEPLAEVAQEQEPGPEVVALAELEAMEEEFAEDLAACVMS